MRSPLWREFALGDGALVRVLRVAVIAGGGICVALAVLLRMGWPEQAALAVLTLAIALWVHRSWREGPRARLATLTLAVLSIFSTARYAVWRVSSVGAYLRDSGTRAGVLDMLFIVALLGAEVYAFAVLLLGYVQSAWPLERTPAPLPDDPEEWPAVDVLIPTLNEPLELVRTTALAAMNIDWPGEKLKVWILDDGGREEFRAFAAEAGVGYLARGNDAGAKAGNINHALAHTSAPFVAVFDCDQAPTRSFLQVTMGWLLRDVRLAMVQTPHRFYSPDPFERNLGQPGVAPGEEQLFHGVIQDGNDLWNAASFCGACAVLRREALDDVGGVAMETVTEDVHTSVRMQKRGWDTAYINLPQSAGLATERLRSHVRQRMRWARGMMQVLRLEKPLFSNGLRWQQRLCYLNSAAYFLSALPRLVFLVAPAIYLVLGRTALPGLWAAVIAYALPHLLLASLTHTRMYGRHRQAFWNEIYETVMAPYILLPTLAALVRPRGGQFQVTEKGGVVEREFYDARTALPYLLMLALNLVALGCAGLRLAHLHPMGGNGWVSPVVAWAAGLHTSGNAGAVWINAAWAVFNAGMLSVAAGAARESTQRRRSVRVAMAVPADVIFADGTMAQGVTCDLSWGGMRARMREAKAKPGDAVEFILPLLDGAVTLPAMVVSAEDGELRARFGELGLREAEALTTLLYSRADAWLGWGEGEESRSVGRGTGRAVWLALEGVRRIFGGASKRKSAENGLARVAPILLVGLLLMQSVGAAQPTNPVQATAQGSAVGAKSNVARSGAAKGVAVQPRVNDLAAVPGIFLRQGAGESSPVSIVFAAQPSLKQMQAAGIVASWLGVERGDRAVHFAVSIGAVPGHNGIVLVSGASPMLAALVTKASAAPAVTLVGNPSDAASSVLVLSGNDDNELLTAAMALALHGDTWHGPRVQIDRFTAPAGRGLDDAPRWVSTDRVATFAQAQIAGGVPQGDGSKPVTATLRLPPDLDYGDGLERQSAYQQGGFQQNLALHLDYRYNAVPLGEGSTLQVYVNGQYVSSTPMPHTEKASEVLETVVPVPVSALLAGDNEFTFRFAFRAAPGSANAANLMGTVLKDSYLDISGVSHWTRLPELALFARAGYPFTRRADLADTAVVLPSLPTVHELEMFLTLMARMGAQTGLPATNVTVTDASAVDVDAGKDLLVLGTSQDQPALAKLNAALPVGVTASGLQVRNAESMFGGVGQSVLDRLRRWRGDVSDEQRFGAIETTGELPDAMVQEIEWPRASRRTAVVIVLRDDAGATAFADALNSAAADEMAESVSVFHAGRFSSYRMGSDLYWVGALSPWMQIEVLLEDSPWLVATVAVTVCFLFAILIQARLRRRARERLQTLA